MVALKGSINEKMKIIVGSKNPSKVDAVREIVLEYPDLVEAEVAFVDAATGVSDQPLTLDETIRGAKNRAEAAFMGCEYSIGLESGLMPVGGSKTGYFDVCVCAIYDGLRHHIGLSSAWEFPDRKVLDYIIKDGLNMTEAVHKAGWTENPQIGYAEGAIGLLTRGRLDRKEYTKQALRTALIHLEKNDF